MMNPIGLQTTPNRYYPLQYSAMGYNSYAAQPQALPAQQWSSAHYMAQYAQPQTYSAIPTTVPQANQYYGNMPMPLPPAPTQWQSPPALDLTPPALQPVNLSLLPSPAVQNKPAPSADTTTTSSEPVNFENPEHKHVSYSDALDLVEAKAIKKARIEWTPGSPQHFPKAKLALANGQQAEAILPSNIDSFVSKLDQKDVAYEFGPPKQQGTQKVKGFFKTIAEESIIPTLALGVTGAVGFLVAKALKPLMADKNVINALKPALKDFKDIDYTIEDQLPIYAKDVQDVTQKFLAGEKDFLMLLGPPGTGKTRLLEAVGKAAAKNEGTVTLFANVGEDGINKEATASVRDLLSQLYSGDGVLDKKAIKSLEKLSGGPVKQLVVMANEFEQFSDIMSQIIVNGMGNPSSPLRLRIITTSNRLPGLGEAANSRIQGGITLVDLTPPNKMATIVQSQLAKHFESAKLPEATKAIEAILKANPGYSTRTIADDILGPIKRDATLTPDTPLPTLLSSLKSRLERQTLNDTELAGLIRSEINEQLAKQQGQTFDIPKSNLRGIELLNQRMIPIAQKATTDLGILLQANGRQAQQLIKQAFGEYLNSKNTRGATMPNDFKAYEQAINGIKTNLTLGTVIDGEDHILKMAQKLRETIGANLPEDHPQKAAFNHSKVPTEQRTILVNVAKMLNGTQISDGTNPVKWHSLINAAISQTPVEHPQEQEVVEQLQQLIKG